MNTKTTTTKYIAELEYQATNPQGNTVNIDMYDSDRKQAQSPMELLLSAAASCAAVDVISMLKKKRKTVKDLSVVAEGTRRDQQPKYYTDILLTFKLSSPDTKEIELEKVVALAVDKYCSVAATLRGVAKVRYQSKIEP